MADSLKKKKILFHANLNANHDGSFCQYKLTPTEAEVLYLITTEFLTVSQIALRRKTTRKAVEKIRSKIVKKGYLKIGGSHRGGGVPYHANHIV